MKKIARAAALIGLSMLAISALAQSTGDAAAKPDVNVGDRWVLQHTNGMSNEKDYTSIDSVVGVTDNEIKLQLKIKGKPNSVIQTFTREWNPVDMSDAKFDPFLKNFEFPLQTGKKWKASADKMVFSNGKHGKFYLKGEVVAFEKITVPAGTFDAYKVSLEVEASGTDEEANSGKTIETLWYAPAVKHCVKTIHELTREGSVRSKDINELLEYSLR